MIRKLVALSITTTAALALSSSPAGAVFGSPAPIDAPPYLKVSVMNVGVNYVPTSAKAVNQRQFGDETAIVISSATPAVCTVPANSSSVGSNETTPAVAVTVVGKGSCVIQADQAASARYVAGHSERSYFIR